MAGLIFILLFKFFSDSTYRITIQKQNGVIRPFTVSEGQTVAAEMVNRC